MSLVDNYKRVSQSLLWELQENFYASQGQNAWAAGIPSHVTNSVTVADAYSEVILGYLRDAWEMIDLEQTLYIVEVGAGAGRLGYQLLRALTRKLSYFPQFEKLEWKLVLSDFTATQIEFWKSRQQYHSFVERGVLDFAVFRPEQSEQLRLEVSGDVLSPATMRNPLIVIANYFFDSIKVDLFRIKKHKLYECQICLSMNRSPKHTTADRIDIRDLTSTRAFKVVDDKVYYPKREWNKVLTSYKSELTNGDIIVPVGAFACLDNWLTLSHEKLLLISSDKGFTEVEDMVKLKDHNYALHAGAFSHSVNFDAIARYLRPRGGDYLHTKNRYINTLHTACYTVGLSQNNHLRYAFDDKIANPNALNGIIDLRAPVRDETKDVVLGLLAFVRLSRDDPYAFCAVAKRLYPLISGMDEGLKDDLVRTLERVWDSHYPYPGMPNVPFWIAQAYFHLEMHERALEFLDITIQYFGEDPVLHCMRGDCYREMNQPEEAREAYERSLQLDPGFVEVRERLTALVTPPR